MRIVGVHLSNLVCAFPPPVLHLAARKLNDILQHLDTTLWSLPMTLVCWIVLFLMTMIIIIIVVKNADDVSPPCWVEHWESNRRSSHQRVCPWWITHVIRINVNSNLLVLAKVFDKLNWYMASNSGLFSVYSASGNHLKKEMVPTVFSVFSPILLSIYMHIFASPMPDLKMNG